MSEIGTVIATIEGPNSSEFSFVIKEEKGKMPVRKGQFVQLNTEEGLLVARVSEIYKTNRYFMRAESVREYERSGKPLMDVFPVDRWEYLVAKSVPLGVLNEGSQKRISFPPSPGEKVFNVDEKILSSFLGFNENGIHIGKISSHDMDVKLDLSKLFQKHVAILAISGGGKSYLASVLIEEILKRNQAPAVVILDPHGEYKGFSHDENFAHKTKIFNEKSISIAARNLSAFQLSELMPHFSSVQRRELNQVIQTIRTKKHVYNLEELIQEVEASEIKPATKEPMISWLMELNSSGLFINVDSPSVEELAKPGQISVFDLSEFVHLRDRQLIATSISRKLFDARRNGKISPFVLFVEEAHQFCPEGVERESAISRSVIEQISREGRKFNACLVLISQRPIRLSTTALSQCNTHIILRITNPYDLDHIGKSSEGITRDVLNMIPGLKVGEALIVGEAVNYPLLVNIRNRSSKKFEKTKNLEDAMSSFNQDKLKTSEDLQAFS